MIIDDDEDGLVLETDLALQKVNLGLVMWDKKRAELLLLVVESVAMKGDDSCRPSNGWC